MKKLIALSVLAGAALLAPASASAQSSTTVASLEQRASVKPNDGGTQIELAQAYAQANRPGDAARAYKRALQLDNEMMETGHGDAIWSHQVAKLALGNNVAVANR
jgi:cytochrome c-type biogenesis protein CcmH/NrfG